MFLTTQQAAETWCPMVRVARRENTSQAFPRDGATVGGCNTDALGGNRVPASCRCIADKCAMWRWGSIYMPPADAEPGKIVASVVAKSELGYCGLAGTPTWQS